MLTKTLILTELKNNLPMDLKFFLEDLFKLKVDLVISTSLKPRIKPVIDCETQYV